MTESIFVNKCLTLGFENYLGIKNTDAFECHVVECLVHIYGQDIVEAYKEKSLEKFDKVMRKYGLSENIYTNFMDNLEAYGHFKERIKENPNSKTDIMSNIDVDLIKMYEFMSAFVDVTEAQLSSFENDMLKNHQTVKMHFNYSNDPKRVENFYKQERNKIGNRVQLTEQRVELLDDITYSKFGVSIDDVKNMDYRMVNKLNNYINDRIAQGIDAVTPPKKKLRFNSVLSSGNGFVDILLILSIIATEVSIGLIYMFLHI